MFKNLLTSLFLVSLLLAGPAIAQDKIPWTELSLEERQILRSVESQWDELSGERQ